MAVSSPGRWRKLELCHKGWITYAVNELFIDWDNNDMSVWNPNDMGQWPFGNQLSDEEVFFERH